MKRHIFISIPAAAVILCFINFIAFGQTASAASENAPLPGPAKDLNIENPPLHDANSQGPSKPDSLEDSDKKSLEKSPDKEKDIHGPSNVKTEDTEKKKPVPRYPNRRWIINQPGGGNPGERTEEPFVKPELAWTDEAQKIKCESSLEILKNSFRKAKYYSVEGDPCRTSAFAKAFIEKAEQCGKDCPEGFLEHSGFSKESLRNIKTLYRLGREKCLGPDE